MEHEIKIWLGEQKQELVTLMMKLIEEDAPKNKFSIPTGKFRMIEEVEGWIEKFEKSRKS